MPQLWPFKPLSGITEVWEYATDVMRSHDKEQRLALRPGARRTFEINHVFDSFQYASAQEIIRRFEDFYFPDWTQQQDGVDIPAGSDVSIDINTTCFDFGDYAVIWKSPDDYEIVPISSWSSDGLIATVAETHINARVMPCWTAIIPGGLQTDKMTRTYSRNRLSVEIIEQFNFSYSEYPQYRGLDVMTDCPILAGGLSDELQWETTRLDNRTGLFQELRRRGYPDAIYPLRWRLTDQCSQQSLRRWLDSRLGRQKAFWISSRTEDFGLASMVESTDTEIEIQALIGITPFGRDSFDIEILLTDGTIIRRSIDSWAVTSSGTILAQIDSSPGVEITEVNLDRISNLRLVRMNADRFEFSHQAQAGAELATNCIETPYPETGSSL